MAEECTPAMTSRIIGASLSEPHIDGDVRPTSRGMFVCIWPRGAFVLPMFPRSHVGVHIDRAQDVILTWRDSKQARQRIGDAAWIDFYKVRVLPGSDNEQQSHLITELYDWSDNGNTRAEGLLLCICRKMGCS